MLKIPFYFSIDFEDFHYDVTRSMGHKNPKSKKKALLRSYDIIKEISNKYLMKKKLTFFVTGCLAREFPEIIRQIHLDGNEIACHYNNHDKISDSNRGELIKNLDEAISSIKEITGEKPLGFRAPFFGINNDDVWAYEEIAKRFAYDSSYITSKSLQDFNGTNLFDINNNVMREFYIYSRKIFPGFKIRSGGTYLRLFPAYAISKTMKDCYKKGHIPLLYLHPYDLTQKHDFFIRWKDIGPIGFIRKTIFWFRQFQWSHLGHKTVDKKIEKITKIFEHQGLMRDLLK